MMFIIDTFITLGPIKTGEKKEKDKKFLYYEVYIHVKKNLVLQKNSA